MVKNRSQQELSDEVSLEAARASEEAYFNNHSEFSKLGPSFFGVNSLTAKLTAVLVDRIKDSMPTINTEVTTQLKEARHDLEKLEQYPSSQETRRVKLAEIAQGLAKHLEDVVLKGDYKDPFVVRDEKRYFYARARQEFTKFQSQVNLLKPKFDTEYRAQMEIRISSQRGRELPGFLNRSVFEAELCVEY
jgi:hypothetical protein